MQTLYEINYGIKSDVGRVRKNNEDYITYFIPTDAEELKKNGSLFIVADGVGGAAKGEDASRFAGETVRYEYYHNTGTPPAERLVRAMQKASREIFEHSQVNGNFTRMATTMVAALVLQNNLIVAHVGDSRLYLMRDGKIKQLTHDHSVVAEMVRNGVMTEEEARTSKAKNRLSRSIGGEAEVHVDVSEPLPLNLGDRVLLCSDGLTRYLDGEDLKNAALKGDVETTVKELVKNANEQGGIDNISVILFEMVQKARMRVKRPAARQTPPEKLGWDEAQTEYPQMPVPQKRKLPVWALAATGAILLVTMFITFRFNQSDSLETPTSTKEQNLGNSATNPPSITETQNIPNTSTPGVTTTVMLPVDSSWECVYRVISEDTIGKILGEFAISTQQMADGGKDPTLNNYYQYYEKCEEVEGKFTCGNEPKEYSDPSMIYPDQWFIVFISTEDDFDFNREYCESKGGYVFEITREGE